MDSFFISKAKTAFHSAAAKAEKVLVDIKADLRNDRGNGDKSVPKKSVENEMRSLNSSSKVKQADDVQEDSLSDACGVSMVVPIASLKQLGTSLERGKAYKSVRDILMPSADSSPVHEKGFVPAFSAVRSLVLREKDISWPESYDEVSSQIQLLFNTEHVSIARDVYLSISENMTSIAKESHGTPCGTFVVRLAEVMGSLKGLRKMALFWLAVIAELRRYWSEGRPVPLLPEDVAPDLDFSLLHQKLQVINCCIARERRKFAAIDSLNSVMDTLKSDSNDLATSSLNVSDPCALSSRDGDGNLVLRLGADQISDLTMLDTGEPIYSPITQEGPIFTEDLLKETEEFVLRTGSVGAGCSQLLSDMQAFKAANPGCVLEDFVRWHSPPDWIEPEPCSSTNSSSSDDVSNKQGQLSRRMSKEGNLWQELWENAKPLAACLQTPLYDEDLAVENIFDFLEKMAPADIFQTLFIASLGSALAVAEASISADHDIFELFNECKDYVIATCRGELDAKNIEHLCQVYETVERLIVYPSEALMVKDTTQEANASVPKHRFHKFNLNFRGRKQQESFQNDDQPRRFASFFEPKSSLLSKKPMKASPPDISNPLCVEENGWTVV